MAVDFKVNDRVRIVKKVEDCGYHKCDGKYSLLGWAAQMGRLLGKTGRVTYIEDHDNPAIAVACEGECTWWFSAESLELEKE